MAIAGVGQAASCGLNPARARGYHKGMVALRFFAVLGLAVVLAVTILTDVARAQTSEMPHWRTLRFDTVNMRVGPSTEYKIDWVYKREGLPVIVLRQRDGWLLVRDHEGTQGWVASSQTTTRLGGLIIGDGLAELRAEPSADAPVNFRAEPGVVGRIRDCGEAYCEIDVDGRAGWVAIERLWGVGAMEPDAPEGEAD